MPEAPYWHTSRVPGAGFYTLTVNENAAAGTQLAVVAASSSLPGGPEGGLYAIDEDVSEGHGNLTYTWKLSDAPTAAVANLFTLNSRTGVVTVSAAGAAAGGGATAADNAGSRH